MAEKYIFPYNFFMPSSFYTISVGVFVNIKF